MQLAIVALRAPVNSMLVVGLLEVLRPAVARDSTRLPFVRVLMGCLGGFEAFGLIGLVIGPVALTLVREIWEQRMHEVPRPIPGAATLR